MVVAVALYGVLQITTLCILGTILEISVSISNDSSLQINSSLMMK